MPPFSTTICQQRHVERVPSLEVPICLAPGLVWRVPSGQDPRLSKRFSGEAGGPSTEPTGAFGEWASRLALGVRPFDVSGFRRYPAR